MSDRKMVFADIVSELKINGVVSIHGFGKFQVVDRPARKGRNPRTGEEIDIPAKSVVKFTQAKALKEAF